MPRNLPAGLGQRARGTLIPKALLPGQRARAAYLRMSASVPVHSCAQE